MLNYLIPSTKHLNLLLTEVTEEFRTSRDYEDLKRMWLAWRRSSGRSIRPQFRDYVNLANRGAQNIELTNLGQMWRVPYEMSNLKGDVKNMYQEMLPMYKYLHAYIRMQLRKVEFIFKLICLSSICNNNTQL